MTIVPPIEFASAARVAAIGLRETLDQVVVTIPDPRPTTFVHVWRSGGPRLNLVTDDAQLTVDSWAGTDFDAEALAEKARTALVALRGTVVDGTPIYRIKELSGPAPLPDGSKQFRYRQTFTVAMRGAAA